jgi:hypothetical protein
LYALFLTFSVLNLKLNSVVCSNVKLHARMQLGLQAKPLLLLLLLLLSFFLLFIYLFIYLFIVVDFVRCASASTSGSRSLAPTVHDICIVSFCCEVKTSSSLNSVVNKLQAAVNHHVLAGVDFPRSAVN